MSLLNELLKEKQKQSLKAPEKLPEQKAVLEIVFENPTNDVLKQILETEGMNGNSSPTSISYSVNRKNSEVAKVLSAYGSPEI